MLFDNDRKPTPTLLEVLRIAGVDHDGTLAGIHEATQGSWYVAGKLRAEIEERHAHNREDLMPLFSLLGLVEAVHAKREEYSIALLLGATLVAVRKRLAFLIKEWERGVRFKLLILVGSSRKLLPTETVELMLDPNNPDLPFDPSWCKPAQLPLTEGQMMRLVYDQVDASVPWKFQVGVVFSFTEGTSNTAQSVEHWAQAWSPPPATCLAVSSQPFVADQQLAIRKVLADGFQAEGVGYPAPPSIRVSVFLDSLAKQIDKLAD